MLSPLRKEQREIMLQAYFIGPTPRYQQWRNYHNKTYKLPLVINSLTPKHEQDIR